MDKRAKVRLSIVAAVVSGLVVAAVVIFFILAGGHREEQTPLSSFAAQTAQEPRPPHPMQAKGCDFASWVGHAVDKKAAKETARPVRILTPDSVATMDYSSDRINIHVDAKGIVTKVDCG